VPADEILFFANTPVRVDAVTAKRGSQVAGDLMTVSNTTLAIDAGLSPSEVELVRPGMRVRIEDPETAIDLRGRVTRIADRPGTNPQLLDPTKTSIEVTPVGADKRLVNTSVRLRIAIKSTSGKVLTVPVNALSVGADGRSRVQVDAGAGRTRIVPVIPHLAAAGIVEVQPRRRGTLKAGDRVVIGAGSPSAAGRAPTGSRAPATPPGVSTTPAPSQATTTPDPAATTPPPAGAGASTSGAPSGTRGP
jgi:HlyD family secretion protein